jgi:hypothetical protein
MEMYTMHLEMESYKRFGEGVLKWLRDMDAWGSELKDPVEGAEGELGERRLHCLFSGPLQ